MKSIRWGLKRILTMNMGYKVTIIIYFIYHPKFGLDYRPKKKSKLYLVRISFETPIFDKITKDEKSNFETKISVIGGTMGLLCGFSIISGVEILYFATKIFFNYIKEKMNKKNKNVSDEI